MTTERLYYENSYTTQFPAQIIEHIRVNDRPAVIMDRTYFYPTGGGQPFDTGIINGIPVTDVFPREDDAAVIHVLAGALTGDVAEAQVDWTRRFDHMQQHTGQHILTQAFVQTANIKTIGFHLSPDSVTIDLDTANLTDDKVDEAEQLANTVIYENRAVIAHLRDMDDQEGVRIRRLPRHLLTEGLRVIEVEGFDTTACGGTHVAHTGEIGIIKMIKIEKRGTKTRLEFCCGGRALKHYRDENRVANQLAADLNCRFPETIQLVENLHEDIKSTSAALKEATARLIDYEAAHLLASTVQHGEKSVIIAAFENRSPAEVRLLVSRLVLNPKTITLLGIAGEKAQLFFARSDDMKLDMGQILRESLTPLGGRGGGQPNFTQGGGIPLDRVSLLAVLTKTANKF